MSGRRERERKRRRGERRGRSAREKREGREKRKRKREKKKEKKKSSPELVLGLPVGDLVVAEPDADALELAREDAGMRVRERERVFFKRGGESE